MPEQNTTSEVALCAAHIHSDGHDVYRSRKGAFPSSVLALVSSQRLLTMLLWIIGMRGSRRRERGRSSSVVASAARALAMVVVACALVLPLCVSDTAIAQTRIEFIAQRLRDADFRVRTNAALALGATDDDAAVSHLCGALQDSNSTVREATTIALKRLSRQSSLECLKQRLRIEPTDSVKQQLARAIESIESGAPPSPPLVPNAKFYVAFSHVNSKTDRGSAEVERLVHDAIRSKLASARVYQLAPINEAPEAARSQISRRGMKGYYLSISVEKTVVSGSFIRMRARLAVFSYPGKDLRGEVSGGAMNEVRAGDREGENLILQTAVEAAIDNFIQAFK